MSRVGLADELPTMIGEADVVVAALPLVPATTHLFDAKMFARMKKTAYFINVGRGGSVVTDDLVAALNAGTIAGAGLDVTEPEPLPKDHAALEGEEHHHHAAHVGAVGPGSGRAHADPAASRCAALRPATSCCRWSTSRRVIRRQIPGRYLPPAYILVSR